jgi:hypothetical protein
MNNDEDLCFIKRRPSPHSSQLLAIDRSVACCDVVVVGSSVVAWQLRGVQKLVAVRRRLSCFKQNKNNKQQPSTLLLLFSHHKIGNPKNFIDREFCLCVCVCPFDCSSVIILQQRQDGTEQNNNTKNRQNLIISK